MRMKKLTQNGHGVECGKEVGRVIQDSECAKQRNNQSLMLLLHPEKLTQSWGDARCRT